MGSPLEGKFHFVDASYNDSLLTQILGIIRVEQIRDPATTYSLSSDGGEFTVQGLKQPYNTVSVYSLLDASSAPDEDSLVCVGISVCVEDPIRKHSTVQVLVPESHREKGMGTLTTACTLHRLFNTCGTAVAVAKTCDNNNVGIHIMRKFLKPVGRMPRDWLWRGVWFPSVTHAISIDDLLAGHYNKIREALDGRDITGIDSVPMEKFENLRLRGGQVL